MTPPLRTERLDLVPLEVAHAALLYEGMRDWEVYRFGPQTPPASLTELEATLRRRIAGAPDPAQAWYNWTPFVRATGDAIGNVQITILSDGTALLGYFLLRPWWRRGFGREGSAAAVAWAAGDPSLHTIVAEIDAENAASIKLVESLGFTRTGANMVPVRGQLRDEARYELTLKR